MTELNEQAEDVPTADDGVESNDGAAVHYDWQDEPPSEQGYYWYRDSSMSERICSFRGDGLGDGHVKFFLGSPYALHELPESAEWAGPIPKPLEPKATSAA